MDRISKRHLWLTLKWLFYAVSILILFVLQSTPSFLQFWGAKPVLVLPAAVMAAILEGEFGGALTGLICGLLIDLGAGRPSGVNGLFLMILCMFIGLLFIYYIRTWWLTALLFTLATSSIIQLLDFFFFYALWGYDGLGLIFLRHTLPTIGLTTLFSLPLYAWFKWLHARCTAMIE